MDAKSSALVKPGAKDTSWASLGIDTKLGWRSALMDEAEAHLDGRGRAVSLDSARAGPYPYQLSQRQSSAATDGVRLGSCVSANGLQGSAVTASTLQSRFVPAISYMFECNAPDAVLDRDITWVAFLFCSYLHLGQAWHIGRLLLSAYGFPASRAAPSSSGFRPTPTGPHEFLWTAAPLH